MSNNYHHHILLSSISKKITRDGNRRRALLLFKFYVENVHMKQIPTLINQLKNAQHQAISYFCKTFKKLLDFAGKIFLFLFPFVICLGLWKELTSWNTKEILIACVVYVTYTKINALIKKQKLPYNNQTFNSILAKELMSIKFKLNELIDHNTPFFPKSEYVFDEMARKAFTQLWFAYNQYPSMAKLATYETPNGSRGAMIILLQLDDPLSDMKCFNEEELFKLISPL